MKTLSLLLLTSTVMAHPLRGADRFVEVRADDYTSANDAFSACTNDALIGAGSDKSLALACKMTPGCESLMDAAKSVESGVAAAKKFAESEDGKAALAKIADENADKFMESVDIGRGATNWLANTFQLFSPSIMRQCLVCVLGLPKKQFGKFMKQKIDQLIDGNKICTIDITMTCDDKGKKGKLLTAWAKTTAGELQTAAKTKGTAKTAGIEEKLKHMDSNVIQQNVIFSQMLEEVQASRAFWNKISWPGKDKACILKVPPPTDFSGHAWSGGECGPK